jgi:chromosome segregation ATPase
MKETISSPSDLEELQKENSALKERVQTLEGQAAPQNSAELIRKVKSFTTQIEILNGSISSMETQLQSLYGDKERLEREIGASEVDDIIEAFRGLEIVVTSMEKQLMTLYAAKEHLETNLGESDPTAIVDHFLKLNGMVETLRSELGNISKQATNLRKKAA